MLFTQGDQVLFANQRLTTGIYVHVYAHFLALSDDGIDLVKGQVELVAVFRGPAASAVQVAGGGRVKKDSPRNIAIIFFPVFLLLWPANDIRVEEEIFKGSLQNLRIRFLQNVHNELIHVVLRVFQHLTDCRALDWETVWAITGQLVHPRHQFQRIFFRVFLQIAKSSTQSCFFQLICK